MTGDDTALTPTRSPRPVQTRPRGEMKPPWEKGVSGNPRGRPKGRYRAASVLLRRVNDREEAESLATAYLELCHSPFETIRLQALLALYALLGLEPPSRLRDVASVQVNQAISLTWDGNGDAPR